MLQVYEICIVIYFIYCYYFIHYNFTKNIPNVKKIFPTFKIHQAGQIEHPSGPVLGRELYV